MQAESKYRATSPHRRRRSSGHAMMESVFTLIPTFALIFGFVDVGLMLFRWSTLQNAVREGARYAITFQTTGGFGQDGSIQTIVERYAMGIVKKSDSPQRIFIDYYAPADLYTAAIPPANGGNVPGNLVEVSVKNLPLAWIAPLSGSLKWNQMFYASSPFVLSVYSSDILGGYPAGVGSVAR